MNSANESLKSDKFKRTKQKKKKCVTEHLHVCTYFVCTNLNSVNLPNFLYEGY